MYKSWLSSTATVIRGKSQYRSSMCDFSAREFAESFFFFLTLITLLSDQKYVAQNQKSLAKGPSDPAGCKQATRRLRSWFTLANNIEHLHGSTRDHLHHTTTQYAVHKAYCFVY